MNCPQAGLGIPGSLLEISLNAKKGLGFKVWGLGFRVEVLGFRF